MFNECSQLKMIKIPIKGEIIEDFCENIERIQAIGIMHLENENDFNI